MNDLEKVSAEAFARWIRTMPERDLRDFEAMGHEFYEVCLAAFQGGFASALWWHEHGDTDYIPRSVH